MTDDVLAAIAREAQADDNVVAVVLHGSRSAGQERADSDYDLFYVVASPTEVEPRPHVDRAVVTLDELCATDAAWWTDTMVDGTVLVDKTDGELAAILERLGRADDVERPYDAYLNAFVRGVKSARRGDELGARLHAADSVRYLIEALAALEGRRPRFHDRLRGTLGVWESRLLAILREPDVEAQLELRRDVQELMESRGVLTHRTWKPEQLV